MKLTAKQYAEVLVNVVSKAPAAAERFSESFWTLLKENRQEKLLGSIMRHAKKIWNEKHGIMDVKATVAQDMSNDQMKHLSEMLESALGKKINLDLRTNAGLKGGIVLEVGDSRYDASIAGRLERLGRMFE